MMEEATSSKPAFRFLSFANVEEDAEKEAKLKEAAAKLEQAIAKEKALSELVDYKEQNPDEVNEPYADPANDTRSLYERLREVRDKKKDDIEESQKLSNLVTKLDEDDVTYLNEVAKSRREEELRKRLEIKDALEAKRLLDEQKMVEQERKMKESLLGKTSLNSSRASASHKSSMSKLMMNSKIKVKPKPVEQDSVVSTDGTTTTTTTTASRERGTTGQKTSNTSMVTSQGGRNESERDTSAMNNSSGTNTPEPNSDGQRQGGGNRTPTRSQTQPCTCPKGVMTSMGVLASLPIVREFRDSSDDSDYSDDDLERRLVPRSFKRRK